MQIKLKSNEHSIEIDKVPYYTDWNHVEACQLGDVQDTFFDQGEIDCMLIMGKDGKSMEDYFAWVELGSFVFNEVLQDFEFISNDQRVWVHYLFLYDQAGNKLSI